MKTCPHCAETDLQDEAKVCKHCGKNIKGESGCTEDIFKGGAVICIIVGFFFWPAWILAAILLIAVVVDKD